MKITEADIAAYKQIADAARELAGLENAWIPALDTSLDQATLARLRHARRIGISGHTVRLGGIARSELAAARRRGDV